MTHRERFKELYFSLIKREGADKLYDYLTSTGDFLTAPASTRFHLSYEGGLLEHSLNVYDCLNDYLERSRVKELYGMEYSPETIAIVSLLHDVCKVGCYKKGSRNVKNANGVWESVPTYEFEDKLPYGHGEKSVYIISGYMKLTREEAFAIRYHMGFSGTDDVRNVSTAFEMFPLAYALSVADSEATFFIESKK
jgi:hypothetical protein